MINGNETIEDLLKKYPALEAVLSDYDLNCVGCCSKEVETLIQGAKSHGFDDSKTKELINACNEYLSHGMETLNVSSRAAKEIKDILQEEKKEGAGLKIQVIEGGCCGTNYDLSVEDSKDDDDLEFVSKDIKLFVAKDQFDTLKGVMIDFVQTAHGAGFRVINPNEENNCACSGSCSDDGCDDDHSCGGCC